MRRAALVILLLAGPTASEAQQSSCRFTQSGAVWVLNDDCVTYASITIPDGMTLDGNQHTIFAVDPPDMTFQGGIVVARGGTASIINTTITAILLANKCQAGTSRLRGIYFEGASGTIKGNTIDNVNKGATSDCEEGNGIEVRNSRIGGPRSEVDIDHNLIDRYQKTGVIVHGNVSALVQFNVIRASVAQDVLAANAVQIGPGALARLEHNIITGNSFSDPQAAGTAILLVDSGPGTVVLSNTIVGNADVGIHVLANEVLVEDNELLDVGPDGYYDVGIVNLGSGNLFIDNTVRGFRTRFYGIEGVTGSGIRSQRIE
jgi:hypothetical protein